MTFLDFFNLSIQWTDVKGLAIRLLGIDFMLGCTNDFHVVDIRITPKDNVMIMVQIAWVIVYIGREDILYG